MDQGKLNSLGYVRMISNIEQEQGFLGYVCFILAFIVQICLGIPSTLLEAMSGFIFGFWKAMIVTTIGKTSGCMVAFTIGGILGKDTLGAYMNRKFPTFKAMNKVFANADYKLLCMFQLAYIPIFFKCFGLSIMNVKPFKFFITTLICGIPYTAFWSYLGSQSHNLLKVLSGEDEPKGGRSRISTEQIVLVAIGVLSGIVAMFLLAKYSREQLHLIRENNRLSEEAMENSKSVVVFSDISEITPEITILTQIPPLTST